MAATRDARAFRLAAQTARFSQHIEDTYAFSYRNVLKTTGAHACAGNNQLLLVSRDRDDVIRL